MDRIFESSLNDLYQSAVQAFPGTTRRQHATNTIVITDMHWTPFVGMKTLYVRGLAQNEGKEYRPTVLFKQVAYHPQNAPEALTLTASDGMDYFLEQLSTSDNDVLVRCDCPDFYWRFNYWNHLDRSLYNRVRKKYEGQGLWEANPQEIPGMCKHIMKMMKVLDESGLVT